MGFYRFQKTHHRRNFLINSLKNFSGTPDIPDIMGLTFFCSAASAVELFFGPQYKKGHLKRISFFIKTDRKVSQRGNCSYTVLQ